MDAIKADRHGRMDSEDFREGRNGFSRKAQAVVQGAVAEVL
jgi:hypothetical protein